MDDWASTVTGWADKALGAFIDKKVNNPHELQKLQMQAYGSYGFYPDAQGNYNMPVMGQAGGMSPVVMIGGALLLVVLLLKD